MSPILRSTLLSLLMACGTSGLAGNTPDGYAEGGAQQCLECHDFGPEAPVNALLRGSHGLAGDAEAMAGRHGCEDCHGPSQAHSKAPMVTAPGVSFGPRWSATSASQDSQCLTCHEQNVTGNWEHALHMFNNLTCVTCHDIHVEQDKVLFSEQQAQVCTVCHKAQKSGIHGREDLLADNPPCTSCHNPHDHETADAELLDNDSAGCRGCHDLDSMATSESVSSMAKRRHRLMSSPDSSCLDCHQGVAHTATPPGPAAALTATASKEITLFYPGLADSDWLLHRHPGSQPLRQGRNCQQCHRGEEAQMGLAQAGPLQPASRSLQVSFEREQDQLLITLRWPGQEDDQSIALMWGDESNEAFRRGGCFAACHSDLPGMSQDRGQQTGKYLAASRTQRQAIGQASLVKDEAALKTLINKGVFVEMWRVKLHSEGVETAVVLEDAHWQAENLIWINKSYRDGYWTVALRRGITNNESGQKFLINNKYTFGIALTGAANPGGKHWVSLPMTLSFDGDETDFTVE